MDLYQNITKIFQKQHKGDENVLYGDFTTIIQAVCLFFALTQHSKKKVIKKTLHRAVLRVRTEGEQFTTALLGGGGGGGGHPFFILRSSSRG